MRTAVLSLFILALTIPVCALRVGEAGPERVVKAKQPARLKQAPRPQPTATPAVSFVNDVMPLLGSLGCNATECHGSTGGKGGFKLSLFGADPEQDYTALTRSAEGRRVNRVEPLKSLLLLKATASIDHGGKQRVKPDSPEYEVLASWLAQGALRGGANGRTIKSIVVLPEKKTLAKGQTHQLSATAVFADGTRQDVTRNARYQSSDDAVVAVEPGGKVLASGFGQAHVTVSYIRRSAVAQIVVPQPLSSPFPPSKANNKIDELVWAKLKELGIPPSGRCTDQEFLRRVYLDVIGMLPAPKEVRAYLADKDPQKRKKLVDRLLDCSEFADFWSLKWGDLLRIKAEYPSNLWPNAVQAYHHWVWDSIAKNKPYDEFVRELLVSSGSNFRDPPANYYRALKKRDPQGFAEVTALVFMGARIGCASCHGHPTESWTLEDNLGMAAFFSRIKFKSTKEWKEEVVFLGPKLPMRHPRTRVIIQPKLLDGEVVEIGPGDDPRAKFAQWLTSAGNPWFARNIVNRIWFWLLGRGIVHEPDDIRPTNPPSNAALLEHLEKELIAHKFDLRHIYRLILNSATYQRSSLPNRQNAKDEMFFSHYPIKRLTAEQLSDAIGQITMVWDAFSSRIPEPYSRWPSGFRATQMADGSVGTPFLELFGRPPRDTAYESDRDCRTSMRQALFLITSSQLESKITRSPRIKQWIKDRKSDADIVEEMFLLALSRYPTPQEKQKAVEHVSKDPKAHNRALQDLMWAPLNTKEFMFNH